jgi:acetone carboxylase gamma subunit
VHSINEFVRIDGSGADAVTICSCGYEIAAASENYKQHLLLREGPVQDAGPWVDPLDTGGGRFVCREFFCPGCLRLLDVEIAQRGEPILWDIRIAT